MVGREVTARPSILHIIIAGRFHYGPLLNAPIIGIVRLVVRQKLSGVVIGF